MKKRRVALTTEAHRPGLDAFADAMWSIEAREGWRPADVLRYWLDAAFRALRGPTLARSDFEKNEAEYMAIVKRCRHPGETMSDLARMLAGATLALRAEPVDFIGPVFSELSSDGWMGQFFTPHEVSCLMARLTVGENPAGELTPDRPYLTLHEPACGVGGMVLATNTVLRERGVDVARQAHWTLIDIDHRAMCGAYIQCALTDCSADVFCGDTISLEMRISTRTPAAAIYLKLPRPCDATPAVDRSVDAGNEAEKPDEPAQLSLF